MPGQDRLSEIHLFIAKLQSSVDVGRGYSNRNTYDVLEWKVEGWRGADPRPSKKFKIDLSHNQDCASLANMAGFDEFNIKCLHGYAPSHFYRTRVRSLAMLVTHWLTNSLTPCRLVNLIDVTLAWKDANSKLVAVTVADVDDDDCIGNSLLQIWKLRFGHLANFCSNFQHKV